MNVTFEIPEDLQTYVMNRLRLGTMRLRSNMYWIW